MLASKSNIPNGMLAIKRSISDSAYLLFLILRSMENKCEKRVGGQGLIKELLPRRENEMTSEATAIEAFRAEAKFRCTEPEFAHLNPSPDSVTLQARRILEKCIDEVLEAVRAGEGKERIKAEISKAINEVNKDELDTEDREYVAFYFHKLGNLADVNVSFAMNRWLYGWPIALLSLLRKTG